MADQMIRLRNLIFHSNFIPKSLHNWVFRNSFAMSTIHTKAYIGLGGNLGDSVYFLNQALEKIDRIPGVFDLRVSSFYQTTPVGPPGQREFVNAVCSFYTTHSVLELYRNLIRIERELGKLPKGKYEPRIIDLDLLFFGNKKWRDHQLIVPHPSWDDRLFVLIPLAEIADEVVLPEGRIQISNRLKSFCNLHHETVTLLTQPKSRFYAKKSSSC